MTFEQTREQFLFALNSNAYLNMCECSDMQNAISALEKQIAKKPVVDRYPWAICPVCGGSVYLSNVQEHIYNCETTYCEHCGQALDWSDAE